MNSLCSVGGMVGRCGQDVNSMSFINQYTKNIITDFIGIPGTYIDLSNTSSYAVTSSGLNLDNQNSAFARLKYNGSDLKTADFNTGSFTFYVKYATRYSLLPLFNFQYPNVITLSQSVPISIGSSFTATFFSSLNPGTFVPYVITGCTTSDLNNIASLDGNFTSPYNTITYTISSGIGTITFNVSGGLSKSISIQA